MTHTESQTWAQLVRAVAQDHGIEDLPDVAVEFLLWEHTAWPFGTAAYVERQLEQVFSDFGEERIRSDLTKAVRLPADDVSLADAYDGVFP